MNETSWFARARGAGVAPLAAVLVALATLGLVPSLARGGDDAALTDYVVKSGDTCASIAISQLGDRAAEVTVHLYNPQLGPEPHKLKAGALLKLPKRASATAAAVRLAFRQGPVRVQGADAARGQALGKADRVEVPDGASAGLGLREQTVIRLRAGAAAIVRARPGKGQGKGTSAVGDEIELERGALQAAIAGRGKQAQLTVKTAAAIAELPAGHAVVAIEADGTVRVSNPDGAAVKLRGVGKPGKKATAPLSIAAGMGASIAPGQAPTAARALPAAPTWQPGPALFVALAGGDGASGRGSGGATIRRSFAAVAGARGYRVELARDEAGDDVVASVELDATGHGFEAHHLAPGSYFVRVASRDGELESGRSAPLAVRVVPALALAPGEATAVTFPEGGEGAIDDAAAIDVATAPARLAVARGGTLFAPPGISCGLDGGAAASVLALGDAGDRVVRCHDDGGGESEPFTVRVADVRARVSAAGGGSAPVLARGTAFELAIFLQSDAPLGSELEVVAPAGFAIAVLDGGRRVDGRLRIAITPDETAPTSAELAVVTGRGTAVATVAIAVAPPTSVPPPVDDRVRLEPAPEPVTVVASTEPSPWRVAVGGFGGYAHFSDEFELGNAPDPDYVIDSGAIVGLRGGFWPYRVLGVELELALAPTEFVGGGSATIIASRVHGVIRFGHGRAAALVLAGVGIASLVGEHPYAGGDTDAELHWGVGAEVDVWRDLSVRVEGRQVLGPARDDGSVMNIELGIGVSWSFSVDRL